MKKLTEFENFENEDFTTPADAVVEAEKSNMTAGELIDEWVEKYLDRNGLPKNKRQYDHEAGTSLQTVLAKYGFEIVKKK